MCGSAGICEDDDVLRGVIQHALEEARFDVRATATGAAALATFTDDPPDVLVLDMGLPDADGRDVCQALRARGVDTPVLFLSARDAAEDRLAAGAAGGDDYLAKPFAFSELSARLAAMLRRPAARQEATSLVCGDLEMDLLKRRVSRAGRRLDLLPREFKLLEHLLRHKDRVVTRTMMLEELWDYRFDPHTSLIDTHISRLRKKIDEGFGRPLLHTVRGSGYRLSERP